MITSSYPLTATERVLPKLALDFTTASLDSRITFTRTTDTAHPATYINNAGNITSATNNQPRFDYDPVTFVCKGLLIEESRTNLLLNSLINGTILNTQVVVVSAVATTLSFYGTGTITLSGAHSAVISGVGEYPSRKTYTFTPIAGALTLTVSGTVQYAQLEVGVFATSYIPTTTTALTRNADVATMTGTNFSSWYNASEGSFVTQSIAKPESINGTTTFMMYASATDFCGFAPPAVNQGRLLMRTAAGFTVNISKNPMPSTSIWKQAAGLKTDNAAYYVNGAVVNTDTSATMCAPTTASIGCQFGSSDFCNTHIQKISYWPQRLTNAELAAFSSI